MYTKMAPECSHMTTICHFPFWGGEKGDPNRNPWLAKMPLMLPTKFQFIRESGFRAEDFLEINQSKTRRACGNTF
jgi:hypothetical protein